ncbi:MAG: hypothetical protein HY548_07400 [Elusimicrobia bacterium]|nr:hypothetical protein [Elusimicrobiota bacterium]
MEEARRIQEEWQPKEAEWNRRREEMVAEVAKLQTRLEAETKRLEEKGRLDQSVLQGALESERGAAAALKSELEQAAQALRSAEDRWRQDASRWETERAGLQKDLEEKEQRIRDIEGDHRERLSGKEHELAAAHERHYAEKAAWQKVVDMNESAIAAAKNDYERKAAETVRLEEALASAKTALGEKSDQSSLMASKLERMGEEVEAGRLLKENLAAREKEIEELQRRLKILNSVLSKQLGKGKK